MPGSSVLLDEASTRVRIELPDHETDSGGLQHCILPIGAQRLEKHETPEQYAEVKEEEKVRYRFYHRGNVDSGLSSIEYISIIGSVPC